MSGEPSTHLCCDKLKTIPNHPPGTDSTLTIDCEGTSSVYVAARAEEYQVFIDSAWGAYRFRHVLAEDTPGKSLAENDARLLAQSGIDRDKLPPLDIGDLEPLSLDEALAAGRSLQRVPG